MNLLYGHLWSFDFQQVLQDNSLGESIILGVETSVCMCEEKKKKNLESYLTTFTKINYK